MSKKSFVEDVAFAGELPGLPSRFHRWPVPGGGIVMFKETFHGGGIDHFIMAEHRNLARNILQLEAHCRARVVN